MNFLLLTFHYRDTVTLGSLIVGLLVGIAGLGFIIYGVRYRAAYEAEKAVSTSLADGRDAYKLRAERLSVEKDEVQTELGRAQGLVDELKNRPTFEQILPVLERMNTVADERAAKAVGQVTAYIEKAEQRTVDAFASHENRAQERHEAEMAVMQEILREES